MCGNSLHSHGICRVQIQINSCAWIIPSYLDSYVSSTLFILPCRDINIFLINDKYFTRHDERWRNNLYVMYTVIWHTYIYDICAVIKFIIWFLGLKRKLFGRLCMPDVTLLDHYFHGLVSSLSDVNYFISSLKMRVNIRAKGRRKRGRKK
jgi:hypothetical protein